MSWGAGRQNSPRLVQSSAGPQTPRPGPHDYSPSSGADQRVVNGGRGFYIFQRNTSNAFIIVFGQPHILLLDVTNTMS